MRRDIMLGNSSVVIQILQGDIGILWVWNFSLPISRQKYEIGRLFVILPENAVFLNRYNQVKFNLTKEERDIISNYAEKIAEGYKNQWNIEKEIEEEFN